MTMTNELPFDPTHAGLIKRWRDEKKTCQFYGKGGHCNHPKVMGPGNHWCRGKKGCELLAEPSVRTKEEIDNAIQECRTEIQRLDEYTHDHNNPLSSAISRMKIATLEMQIDTLTWAGGSDITPPWKS